MLDQLSHASFAPHVDETFELQAGEMTLELTLAETSVLGGDRQEGQREQFSLLFRGRKEGPLLQQGTFQLRHQKLGELALFLVPLGPDADGMRYEAVFT